MGIIIITAIILFILAIVCFVGCYFKFEDEKNGAGTLLVVLGLSFLIAFAVIPFSFHQVETGEVAVVKHLGEAKEIREAGLHFDFWMTEKYEKYDAKVQTMEIQTMAYSKDAQTMTVMMSVQYQIKQDDALNISKHYGSLEVLASRVQSIAIEKTKSTLSAYSAMNIIETRSSISPQVEEAIKSAVTEEYYIDIVAVVLTNIDFSDAFEQTVENKMIAEQEKLKAEYEKETAIVNAEKELEVAKLAAQARLEAAKADAEAQLEIARAEALATQLKSIEVARALGFKIIEEVVTDEETNETYIEYTIDFEGKTVDEINLITDYLQYLEYLAKWDGKLPSVVTEGSATVVVPMP